MNIVTNRLGLQTPLFRRLLLWPFLLSAVGAGAQTRPAFTHHPFSQSVPAGADYVMRVAATGARTNAVAPADYFGGEVPHTNLMNAGSSSGTLLIHYDFLSVPDLLQVRYQDVLLFDSGFVSQSGTFSVDFGPGVTSQIAIIVNPTNGLLGTIWEYRVEVLIGRPHFQWWKDDAPLPGATGDTLVLSNALPIHSGRYFVVASNAVGTATSQVATVTVAAPPTLAIQAVSPSASQFDITWPLSFSGYFLWTTTDSNSPWMLAQEQEVPDGLRHRVRVPNAGGTRFFQLRKP